MVQLRVRALANNKKEAGRGGEKRGRKRGGRRGEGALPYTISKN